MNFELTEEQKILQSTTYKFTQKEFEPIAKECDREEKYPRELWKKACETGMVGVFIPEKYGGAGMGFLELALITEQMARVDLGLSCVISAPTFGAENILFFGSEEQKSKYLPLLTAGKAISIMDPGNRTTKRLNLRYN